MSGSWEHFQSVLLQVHNRQVRQFFSDVNDREDDDISQPRSSLRSACLMRDSDSALMALNRFMFFYFSLRRAQDLQTPVYGIPVDSFQGEVTFRPQVKLFFKEDRDDVEQGYRPIEAEISFRLMGQQYSSITEAEARQLANRIRSEFATGQGFRWRKGRLKVSYRDIARGYQIILAAYSEAEARQVLNKVLDIQNHTLDNEFMTISERQQPPPIVPPRRTIYGKSRRLPRKRPVGYVRFQYAELHLWGLPNAVTLVDRSGYRPNPLVSV